MNKYVKMVLLFAQSAFRLIGLDVYPYKKSYHYAPDYFGHAHFKQDFLPDAPVFGDLAKQVIQSGRSSLYFDRLQVIFQAIGHISSQVKPSEKINSAEVGVYKGGTSYFIASCAKYFNVQVTHHCFDTFEGHDARDINSSVDTSHLPAMFNDTQYESVRDYLSVFKNILVFKGRFQETCQELENKKIHFVHLDVDIYDPTMFGLKFFHERLALGGVIIVDDYGFTTCPGVKKAVDEFVAVTPGYFSMTLLTGQYILVKLN
ncbi:MAG: class I SAM-dependent methyltransferase [Anaerolineales bacterium]|nr:class I SAM-dependent methyltransferase [Anaerolineales bacterium]